MRWLSPIDQRQACLTVKSAAGFNSESNEDERLPQQQLAGSWRRWLQSQRHATPVLLLIKVVHFSACQILLQKEHRSSLSVVKARASLGLTAWALPIEGERCFPLINAGQGYDLSDRVNVAGMERA